MKPTRAQRRRMREKAMKVARKLLRFGEQRPEPKETLYDTQTFSTADLTSSISMFGNFKKFVDIGPDRK